MGRILGAQGLHSVSEQCMVFMLSESMFVCGHQLYSNLTFDYRLHARLRTQTPIDTKGFQSVLKLIENTNADSFDLFYGLYKYNRNSGYTIGRLRGALDDVVGDLLERDGVVGLFNNGNRRNLN